MSNLQIISTKELRDNLAEVLEKVAIGKQSFIISKFNKKKALISPLKAQFKKKRIDFKSLEAFGMWKNRKDLKDSAAWVSNLRKKQSRRIKG